MKRLFIFFVIILVRSFAIGFNQPKPNLIVVLVVDQMRSDQPIKWQSQFLATGFNKLIKHGAYAPFAEYPVLQNMTCPGHAMISTGSTPSVNKIPLNEWYSETQKKILPCTFDSQFQRSPRNLVGSTFGDQIRLRYPNSKVVSLAFKDRSAIMLGGHAATAAYWFDQKKNEWVTSDYYQQAAVDLKSWRSSSSPKNGDKVIFVPKILKGKVDFKFEVEWGTPQALSHPIALDQSFEFAKVLLKKYKLGQKNSEPDLLLFSLSNHDIGGHIFGPDSPESQEIMLLEDRKISEFLKFLQSHVLGGLENVWIVLTADHGVAPLVETAQRLGLSAGRIDLKSKVPDWNKQLKSKFYYCSQDWIVSSKSFHLYLNQECLSKNLEKAGMVLAQIMNWVKNIEGVETVIMCDTTRVTPYFIPPDIEKRVKISCVPGVSGQLIVVPKPFWYEQGPPATHMTHYSYDRTVPVVFWGKPFKPGVIQNDVSVLDISSTLLYGLGIYPTAQAEGRVQYQVFK